MISQHDRRPFRLIHLDFGHNNIIVDDEFNVLGVIDWEKSFVGPCEMASRFPIWCLIYPDAIYPLQRDSDGTILDEGWCERYERWRRLVSAIEIHEDRLYVSQRLLTSLFGPSADILYLMRMWEEEKPWLLNYQAGVEDRIDAILLALREKQTIDWHQKAQQVHRNYWFPSTNVLIPGDVWLNGAIGKLHRQLLYSLPRILKLLCG